MWGNASHLQGPSPTFAVLVGPYPDGVPCTRSLLTTSGHHPYDRLDGYPRRRCAHRASHVAEPASVPSRQRACGARCDTLNIAPGERWDVLVKCTNPGTWAFHCHILPHAESEQGMFGMVTALIVTPKPVVA